MKIRFAERRCSGSVGFTVAANLRRRAQRFDDHRGTRSGVDFHGTLREIRGAGFAAIEMCSPPGYTSGFGPLAGMKAAVMGLKIEAAGLRCESCHFQFRELKENLDERLAFARELGLKQMILSTFGLRQGAGMADWTKAAES